VRLAGKVAVVTGGANGIGRALCRRFAAEGAHAVTVADLDSGGAAAVAREIGGTPFAIDVSNAQQVNALVRQVEETHGRIDLFCSNAGVMVEGGVETSDEAWERIWSVNVKAHIYAARAALPGMIARAEGYLLQTVSAAGLLSQIGSAPYAVTKHASLAFAEWLAITHFDQGIRVSALCPQGVRTAMLGVPQAGIGAMLLENALEPEQVADAVVKGLADERFLILPHPEVADYFRRKAADYDRWLRGMRRLQSRTHVAKDASQ
jgi:NAD(P)-dependent dehydrogenase (short-subunit alcohol dehydrogenase family)